MRHLLSIALLFFIVIAITPAPVAAGWEWCEQDPIVHIDGAEVQFLIAVPQQHQLAVQRTRITLLTGTQSMYMDLGFWRNGDEIVFNGLTDLNAQGPAQPIRVNVVVPVEDSTLVVPVRVTVIVDGGAPQVFMGDQNGTLFTLVLTH